MHGSIQRRLTLAFIGLSTIPLLLVGIFFAWQSYVTQEKQALNLQHEVAQRVSTEATGYLDGLETQLRAISQMEELQKLDRQGQRAVLGELLAFQSAFESLDLLDRNGQEQVHLFRSIVIPDEELVNRAKDEVFLIPKTSGQTYYSPVYFDNVTGEPYITIAVPLSEDRTGQVDGVLVSLVRFQKIRDLIMDLQISPGQSVYIVDSQNNVIAHPNPSLVLRGTLFQVPEQDGIQTGLSGSKVVLAVDRIHLGGQTFTVVAEQTLAEALALAINTVLITTVLLVGMLIVSIALGFEILRQIVHPIKEMATTAQAISDGDLSRQVQVMSSDEVGILAAAFNSMTTQLRLSLEGLKKQVVDVKQAEESLRQANQTLQALIDYSPLAIIMLDLDAHVLLWNKAGEKMYGWAAQEILGESINFLPEGKRHEQQIILERVAQGEILTNLESELIHKDGSRLLSSVSIAPLKDASGNVNGFMSISMDITERKKAEEALRESEERLRQIASSLNEVIWLRDVETRRVLYVNPAFEELTGQTCEAFYKNPDIVIDAVHPDDRNMVINALDQQVEGVPYNLEHRIIHLNGGVRWVSSRSFPVRNAAGEVFRRASIMEDITKRKEAEEEVRLLNAELELRVIDRTAQLEAANKELESFSYSISHDLRAPLRAINGYTRILEDNYTRILDDEGKRILRVVSEQATHMGNLIEYLLAFSHLGKAKMNIVAVNMNKMVDEVFHELVDSAHPDRIKFSRSNLEDVKADPNLLRQVWVNFISNALKYSRNRPVAEIEVGCDWDGNEVTYWIRDNGVGFDMRYVDKLFDIFQRLHKFEEFEGTGVGLSIVQRIVQRHGGQVKAVGKVGQGATFSFTLPKKGKN